MRGEEGSLCKIPYSLLLIFRQQFPFFSFSITARQSEPSARSRESHLQGLRRADSPVFAPRGTSRSHHLCWEHGPAAPPTAAPTGRKELEVDGWRTERGSCSPAGPILSPKFKEKNLARLVSTADLSRCLHNQIILLFSHLLAYFFPKPFVYLPFLPNSAPNLTHRPHHPHVLIPMGVPIKSESN